MLPQFCIRRPIFATVLSLLIVIAGLVALRGLALAQYPEIAPPTIAISTSYPGADAQTLARTVAAPIEEQLSGVEGLLYYETSARANGDVRITATFDVGTDADDAAVEINNRVRSAERRLPDEVRQNGVTVRKRSSDMLLQIGLSSPDKSRNHLELADYARLNITDELKRVPGIGDVMVFGNAESAMRVWLQPDRMAAPMVVAKGAGFVAARIREIARQHGIPIVENKPVARTLFKLVQIGREVPADLYRAVAEILAFVYRVRGQVSPRLDG